MDSAVEGLTYETESMSGETDSQGRFFFKPGETMTFSIGGIKLGTTTARSVITPLALVIGAEDEKNPTVINITRFLITLDEDNNPDNGITISPETRAALADVSINFTQDPAGFAGDADVQNVISIINTLHGSSDAENRVLCTEDEAMSHLGNTLEELASQGNPQTGELGRGGGAGSGGGC
ncbi:MAG TPA: hypothetical protein VMU10_06685, partial [Desulfomonilia bacterium]|nr:hypothetical protein [Desulfomonilia bacterium]